MKNTGNTAHSDYSLIFLRAAFCMLQEGPGRPRKNIFCEFQSNEINPYAKKAQLIQKRGKNISEKIISRLPIPSMARVEGLRQNKLDKTAGVIAPRLHNIAIGAFHYPSPLVVVFNLIKNFIKIAKILLKLK